MQKTISKPKMNLSYHGMMRILFIFIFFAAYTQCRKQLSEVAGDQALRHHVRHRARVDDHTVGRTAGGLVDNVKLSGGANVLNEQRGTLGEHGRSRGQLEQTHSLHDCIKSKQIEV
jgi:hypothetical protein